MTGSPTEFQQLATKVRKIIGHRRCLICSKPGELHRVVVTDDLNFAVISEDTQHHYDPGDRRIGLPR